MAMTTDAVDPLTPAIPAGAYDHLLARVLPQARAQRTWEPSDGTLPALFVSHGAPPVLDDPQWLDDLYTWSQSMPKPRAILWRYLARSLVRNSSSDALG
jgi:4,5-DOPA dioxygenase extradiol